MQALKQQIKEKTIKGIYLFYGEEKFVLESYLTKMIQTALAGNDETMNYDIFEEQLDVDKISSALQTMPFFSEQRVVVIRELDLFKPKNATKVENLLETLSDLPTSTVCFIIENEIDRRSKLFKSVQGLATVVEFKTQTEEELSRYVIDQLKKTGIEISSQLARYFLHVVGYDLTVVHNELKKLIHYSEGNITEVGIGEICTRSIENRIFELVDCMGTRKRVLAMSLYRDLLLLKEPTPRVLFMITRQFRIVLQTKLLLLKNYDKGRIASAMKIAPFIVEKNIKQAKFFSVQQLKEALRDCYQAEVDFKTGKVDLELGIEMLIFKYSSN